MSQILSVRNLRAYARKAGVWKNFPDWPIGDLVYLTIPVLAIRNLDYDPASGDQKYWALSWKNGNNFSLAFWVTGTILKRWQAFRPHPSSKLLKKIEKYMPGVVRRFQRKMRNLRIRTIRDISPSDRSYHLVLVELAKAVTALSQVKSSKAVTPMMGSKILHFLYPEFFPVWDTYWIKKKVLSRFFKDQHKNLPSNVEAQLIKFKTSRSLAYYKAAREYASYVHLMSKEVSTLNRKRYNNLTREFINKAEIGHEVINYHFHRMDMSPLLFETCLLGRYC